MSARSELTDLNQSTHRAVVRAIGLWILAITERATETDRLPDIATVIAQLGDIRAFHKEAGE